MKNIQLVGKATTVTPFNVTRPNLKGLPTNSHGVAYIPATTLRGWLRNGLAYALAELLSRESNKFLTVDEINILANGVDTGRKLKEEGLASVKVGVNQKLREANPFISLFGHWKLAGKLAMGSATPKTNAVIQYGVGSRSNALGRNQDMQKFVAESELDYLQDILTADAKAVAASADYKGEKDALVKELKKADTSRKAEINERLNEIDEALSYVKDERVGAKETVQRTIDGFEAIDAGVECDHFMSIANPSDQEVTALLWLLRKMSFNPVIGGKRHLGCGRIKFQWDVMESSFANPTPKKIGEITIDETGFKTDMPNDLEAFEKLIISNEIDLSKYAL